MKNQKNFLERRKRPRVRVMAQPEDITYSILRKHSKPRQGSRSEAFLKSAHHSRWMKKGPFCSGLLDGIAHKRFLHPSSMMIIISQV